RPVSLNVVVGATGERSLAHPEAGHVVPDGAADWRCTPCVAMPELPASPKSVIENERLPLPLYCGTPEKPPPVGAVLSATTLKAAPAALGEPALFLTVALPLPPCSAVGVAAV